MLTTKFIQEVKAKMNRLDTNAYEDIRKEEVVLYANDALKNLVLRFDEGVFGGSHDRESIAVYLASVTKEQPEVSTTSNAYTYSSILKFKDVEAYVTVDSKSEWKPATRDLSNIKVSERQDNPFLVSEPHKPVYRLTNNQIVFDVSGFSVTKTRFKYLEMPTPITVGGNVEFPFLKELQDETVTLLLENIESQRIQSQPVVSKP